ncbi:hypothetical protein D3C71_1640140 [compost metagenome]
MQVHGQDAFHAHGLEHVGHDLGRDRHARRARATVLAGITEIGDHGADTLSRCTLERVDHHQQFHQVVVGGGAGRLNDEHVAGANVLLDFDGDFTIGEAANFRGAKLGAEIAGNLFGHATVGIAGKNHEI